jgi:ferredoxin-NADP reductase
MDLSTTPYRGTRSGAGLFFGGTRGVLRKLGSCFGSCSRWYRIWVSVFPRRRRRAFDFRSYGSFLAPEPLTQDLIFIARFTGIVPIRCILKKLFAEPVSRKVTLIYGSPSVEKQLYHEEFLAMSQSHSTFQYLPAVSTQAERTAKGLELEILEALWKGSKDFLPMLSGVKAFVRPIKTYLSELGFTRKEIKVEAYD